jgi:malate synthase
MTVSFMKAYTELLVQTCHRRGAHVIGGMAAFIPSRDPAVNEQALSKVAADKQREASQGYDGSWVAHPGLVATCKSAFDEKLGTNPDQKDRLREDVAVTANELQDFTCPGGTITEEGLRKNNIGVGLQYLNSWLGGTGAAAIHNLMEDVATAEISRAQIWQWRRNHARLDDGRPITAELYRSLRAEELSRLGLENERYKDAAEILDRLVLSEEFDEFLTLRAYSLLS